MKYEKGSFLVVPNKKTLEGLDVHAQVVYFWLCDFSDENGECFPSRSTLAELGNISLSSVDKALTILETTGLIVKFKRFYEQAPTSNMYQLNIVQGGSVLGTLGSVPQTLGVASQKRTNSTQYLTQSINSGNSEELQIVSVEPEEKKSTRKDTAYLAVFALWGNYPANWRMNKTQIQAAKNLLTEQTLDGAAQALRFAAKFKDDPFCPEVLSPYDLDSKWVKLLAFKRKRA
jgi:hypothetical protein